MIPQKLALEAFTEGDTWDGIPSLAITHNGLTPASPMALVTLRFKKTDAAPGPAVQLTSATSGQITLTSAAGWTCCVPPQIVPGLTAGKWTWRLRVASAAGTVRTYLAGELTILENV